MKRMHVFYTICLLLLSYGAQAITVAPLPVQDAFSIQVKVHKTYVNIGIHIAKNHYIYAKKTYLLDAQNQIIAPQTAPTATEIHLPGLSREKVYTDEALFKYPLKSHGTFFYQGCSSQGFCYPPQKIDIIFQEKSIHFLKILFFYVYGLLMAFTPCLLPLLPVLSAMIIKKQHTKTQALTQALAYVLGISCAYALMGLVFATIGTNLQVYMQHPWAIIVTSLIYLILGLSLLGAFSIPLPKQLVRTPRLNHTTTPITSFALGGLSILVLSPCITPALFAALTLASQQGHQISGTLSLFLLGLGVGTPLMIISLFGQKILPNNGPWLIRINQILGLILIVLSIMNLSKIMPIALTHWVYMGFAASIVIYFCTKTRHYALKTTLALGLLAVSAWLIFKQLTGSHLQSKPAISAASLKLTPAIVRQEIEHSLSLKKPVFIQFTADWCEACQSMEKSLFSQQQIQQLLQPMTWIKIDLTHENENNKALMKDYQVIAPPTFIWIWENHGIIEKKVTVGRMSASTFTQIIKSMKNTQNSENMH